MDSRFHLCQQFNRIVSMVEEKAVCVAHILICRVDLLLDLFFQTFIKCRNGILCFPLFAGNTALIACAQFIKRTLNQSQEHTLTETLRCGTSHLIIQVVRLIHDKKVSSGIDKPFLSAPELHKMLCEKILIAQDNTIHIF